MTTISPPSPDYFPLTFQIVDGLDGSGGRTIYIQHHSTKYLFYSALNHLLFITTATGIVLWKNLTPNSLYCQRPIFLCAAKENESNIREFMTDLINTDTNIMASEGITLADSEHVQIDIVRSMFDGKMVEIISGAGGAGGASCQLCTAAHNELKDREIITPGFPINRYISDALEMFGEIEDKESLFSLHSNERVNLSNVSTINIKGKKKKSLISSPYAKFLVYHLNCGKYKWSPSSPTITQSMIFVL